MKIVMLVAGSGGTFYCETCLRDTDWVRVMRRRGHDVIAAPVYLPVSMEGPIAGAEIPVFFGGINVYLRDRLPWMRRMPAWLTRGLDSRWLLNLAAKQSGSTKPSGNGSLTLSMLRGDSGLHAAELQRLMDWLKKEGPWDAVVLSSTLLAGLAAPLREALGAPVLAFAHDEDTWLDDLDAPYDTQCWEAMRQSMSNIAGIIAVSRTYATAMQQRLQLPPARVHVVYPGIDPTAYVTADLGGEPPVVGYLSKMTRSLGLGTLVDAVIQLRRQGGFPTLKLKAMGGETGEDARFIAELKQRLADAGMADAAEFLPGVNRQARVDFLRQLTVMSVPMPNGEAFGAFIIESLAAGVPVVLPSAGAFPEVVEATGGGILYSPNTVEALASALGDLLRDRALAAALGRRGKESVHRQFTVDRMADELEQIFCRSLQHDSSAAPATGKRV
jgi:glycosyltransferase involved in cell wall biosynthesis